jgi:hypothetical protein
VFLSHFCSDNNVISVVVIDSVWLSLWLDGMRGSVRVVRGDSEGEVVLSCDCECG